MNIEAHQLVLKYCKLLKDKTYVKMLKDIDKLKDIRSETRYILQESREKRKIKFRNMTLD